MEQPFFTIGHSTRSIGEFIELLGFSQVTLVIDVRTIPRSRTNPQYNLDSLPETLSEFKIGYQHIPELGGLRGNKYDIPPDINAFWNNKSFHNYADYALGESFRSGLDQLVELGAQRRCALMCAEAVWWRCHRRIIADYLIATGKTVFHILGKGHVDLARITSAAMQSTKGGLTYPVNANRPA